MRRRKRMFRYSKRTRFILKYTVRALISLTVVFAAIVLFKVVFFDHNPEYWVDKFYSNPIVIYLIYIGSEVFFGLFPPEIFIVWAFHKGGALQYSINVAFFTLVSLGAGHLAYWIGRFLNNKYGSNFSKRKFITKYTPMVKRYGAVLIIIAALTPLPWSTISLIMGAINFKYSLFSIYSLSRVLRFVLIGYLVYHSIPLLF